MIDYYTVTLFVYLHTVCLDLYDPAAQQSFIWFMMFYVPCARVNAQSIHINNGFKRVQSDVMNLGC